VITYFPPAFQLPPLGEVTIMADPVIAKFELVVAQELMVVLDTFI
jgi:hypothetical protein